MAGHYELNPSETNEKYHKIQEQYSEIMEKCLHATISINFKNQLNDFCDFVFYPDDLTIVVLWSSPKTTYLSNLVGSITKKRQRHFEFSKYSVLFFKKLSLPNNTA